MIIVKSKNNVPIRLTHERWYHIVERHPEMDEQKEKVLETLNTPDLVQDGDFGTLIALKFYPKTPLTTKYLAVIYKEIDETDGFILTAYFTNKPREGRNIIWKP